MIEDFDPDFLDFYSSEMTKDVIALSEGPETRRHEPEWVRALSRDRRTYLHADIRYANAIFHIHSLENVQWISVSRKLRESQNELLEIDGYKERPQSGAYIHQTIQNVIISLTDAHRALDSFWPNTCLGDLFPKVGRRVAGDPPLEPLHSRRMDATSDRPIYSDLTVSEFQKRIKTQTDRIQNTVKKWKSAENTYLMARPDADISCQCPRPITQRKPSP